MQFVQCINIIRAWADHMYYVGKEIGRSSVKGHSFGIMGLCGLGMCHGRCLVTNL